MDYIHEEWKRQRRLWSTLLLGPRQREDGERQDGERQRQEAPGAGGQVREVAAREGEAPRSDGQRASGKWDRPVNDLEKNGEAAAGEHLLSALASRSKRERRAAAKTLGIPLGETAAVGGTAAESGYTEASGGAIWAAAGQESPEPKDLSRIFQRDARRYDGGFTLY